jgi:hypothetical protein
MTELLQYHSGAIIHREQTQTGFTVNQVELYSPPVPNKPDDDDRVDFDIDLGPVHIKGYVDLKNKTVYIEIVVVGISLGSFTFKWDDGLEIDINFYVVKGKLKFYVKDDALWVHIELDVLFDGSWNDDYKIISW